MSKLTYERAKQLYTPYDEGQMRHLCALRDVEIDRLRAENAKLRELCADMWHEGMCECDECGACAECEYGYLDRMRELGVDE